MQNFGMTRIRKRMLPMNPHVCSVARHCVYRSAAAVCDEPQINKGNSDAACHRLGNRELLTMLTRNDAASTPTT
jgi:hypothetical protein